jgi:hypothetical protein
MPLITPDRRLGRSDHHDGFLIFDDAPEFARTRALLAPGESVMKCQYSSERAQ